VLSIDKSDNSLEIGKAALLNQGDNDYEVYTYFKMLLAEQRKTQKTQLCTTVSPNHC